MISYGIELTYTNPVSKRRMARTQRVVFGEIVVYWHRVYLPGHFEHRARWKYRYKPRDPKYEERKKAGAFGPAKKGGNAPLVLHGTLEKAARLRIYVRTFPSRAKGKMIVPRYGRMKPMNPKMPAMGREMTAVVDSEERDMAVYAETRLLHHLTKRKAPPVVKMFAA